MGKANSTYDQNGFYNRLLVDPVQILDISLVDGDGNAIQPLADGRITVKLRASEEFMKLVESGLALTGEYEVKAQDIDFINDCFVFEKDGETVNVPAPQSFLTSFKIIHWFSDAVNPWDFEAFTHDEISVENGYIILHTNHFSEYAVCINEIEFKNSEIEIMNGSECVLEVTVAEGNVVTVKGPKAELKNTFKSDIAITIENNEVILEEVLDEKTKEVETKKPERSIEFIKSKMKFKSILALSLKSLFSKPIRLVFTILLSVIAFSVFGIFDAVASYNGQKALANLLETAQYNAVSVVASVDNDKNNNVQLKLSQNYIDYLNSELGYEFRGIYDLNDKEIISQNKRTNLNYEYSLNQLSTGTSSSTAVSELYYKRKVNGIVEFKESEIKNGVILKNSFNYKILPYENAKYPTLNIEQNGVQEVGISSYLAESISYWLKHNKQTQFGGKDFIQSDLSSLIGARLYVGGHNFIISAIIDCGKIPEKFQVLKHGGNEKNYNLQYDFETYLNSSCNLTLFLPDGYIAQKRAENKRTTTYVADYIGVKYKAQLEGLFKEHEREKDANYFFYNSNNLSKENTIFFDDVENVQNKERKLEKNQVLISVYDLDKYFYQNKTEAVQDGNSAVADLIQKKINPIKNQTSLESKQQSVKDLIEVLQNFHDLNQEQTLKHVLNKEIVVKKYKGENKQASYTQTYTVVGIYFDIDIDSNYQNKYYNFLN